MQEKIILFSVMRIIIKEEITIKKVNLKKIKKKMHKKNHLTITIQIMTIIMMREKILVIMRTNMKMKMV